MQALDCSAAQFDLIPCYSTAAPNEAEYTSRPPIYRFTQVTRHRSLA
jgi:hypothetical protein